MFEFVSCFERNAFIAGERGSSMTNSPSRLGATHDGDNISIVKASGHGLGYSSAKLCRAPAGRDGVMGIADVSGPK